MKNSTRYAPYLYAFLITIVSVLTQHTWQKPGFVFRTSVYFMVLVGMWFWIEWLLTRPDKKWMQWTYVLVGIIMYNVIFLCLDYYVFRMITVFSGLSIWDLGIILCIIGMIATIFIESGRWAREREKAQLDNLRLQAENIASKFQLLREQVNPDFLFQCLTTLQKMSQSDAPETEQYILKLADVYRQVLKKQKNVVSLREELAFLQSYMYLMRYEREKAIFFETDVFDESLDYQLPLFSLQLLADDCIKQNTFSESAPLYIHVFQEDAQSIIMAHNNLQKKAPIHIENLNTRYSLEGIENGVIVEKNESTYSTTLKLFKEK